MFTSSPLLCQHIRGTMKFRIRNFEKYNPRRDQKSCSWFRLENDFVTGQDFHSYAPKEKLAWLLMLGVASKQSSSDVEVELKWWSNATSVRLPNLINFFKKLERDNRVELIEGYYPVMEIPCAVSVTDATRLVTLRTNVTNVTNETRTLHAPIPEKKPRKASPLRSEVSLKKYTDDDFEIGKAWLKFSTGAMTWKKPYAAWTEEKFSEDIAKVRKATELNQDGFFALLNFIENDNFWVKNALVPSGLLRKNSEGIRKVDTILGQMKPASLRQHEQMSTWDENIKTPFD